MLDLVPFAGAGWKMTDRNAQGGLIGEFLQFQFPESQAPAVAATAVGSDQNRLRLRINASALRAPPTPNGGHRKGTGVVIGSHIDKAGIAANVIDPVWVGTGNFW